MADYKNEFGWFAERPQVEKKIYNKFMIFIGLAAFVILATSPLWLNAGRVVPPPDPKLDTPAIQQLAAKDKHCVLPTEEMNRAQAEPNEVELCKRVAQIPVAEQFGVTAA